MQANCYLIFVEFTSKNRQKSLAEIKHLVQRLMPQYQLHVLIVDNATVDNIEMQLDPHTDVIPGDNTFLDLSGYQRGLDWLKARKPLNKTDCLIFANDTVFRSESLKFFFEVGQKQFSLMTQRKCVLGYRDRFPKPVSLGPHQVSWWVRSNLLFTTFDSVKDLSFVIPYSDKDLFTDDLKQFLRPRAALSAQYIKYLKAWLFGQNFNQSGLKEVWYRKGRLTKKNSSLFQAKTKAILCEHFFSSQLRQHGITVVPVQRAKQWSYMMSPLHKRKGC